eukprot:scaffold66311_cov62-Phaeocystis_antarctica.AAC.2
MYSCSSKAGGRGDSLRADVDATPLAARGEHRAAWRREAAPHRLSWMLKLGSVKTTCRGKSGLAEALELHCGNRETRLRAHG